MFEISEETLKEMQQIKETCKHIECVECNYYDDIEGVCKLYYPNKWVLESGE